jgi:hypothetical protein
MGLVGSLDDSDMGKSRGQALDSSPSLLGDLQRELLAFQGPKEVAFLFSVKVRPGEFV